jgi:KUP system potassium uptake protein
MGSTLSAREAKGKGRQSARPSKVSQDITCFNCNCKGHYKTYRWRPGGGKEGLASNRNFQSHTKHINLQYHFICSHIKSGTFKLYYCPSEDNVADSFTKASACTRLQKLRSQMSLACAQGRVLDEPERSNVTDADGSKIGTRRRG